MQGSTKATRKQRAVGLPHVREAGRIVLISCYELGHVPHGASVPAAFLRDAGFDPVCVDVSVESLSDECIDRALVVVISVPMHTALRMGVRVARRIHARRPDVPLGFFGLYAPLNRAYLHSVGADWVMGGECEPELVAWIQALERGERHVPDAHIALRKLSFPRPSRTGLPALERYARFDPGRGDPVLVGYTETSRGCLDTCRHCPVPAVYGGRLFVIDRDVVLDDIATQVAAGARHITFGDPDFLNGPSHGMRILRAMRASFPGLTFDITAQIANLLRHAQHLPELAELGCAFVVSAVESLSDRVLEKLHKRHRRADFELVLREFRRVGLFMRPTFVTFTPWTRLEDIRELIEFLVREHLVGHVDPIQLTIRLLVPPGSLLLEDPATSPAFGALDPEALTHAWRHPDERVDQLQRAMARHVTCATERDEPPEHTFSALRALVHRACGSRPPPMSDDPVAPVPPLSGRVPRITEPWFC